VLGVRNLAGGGQERERSFLVEQFSSLKFQTVTPSKQSTHSFKQRFLEFESSTAIAILFLK
jgi:hypothetical protein